jgi:hypothetical protein
MKLRFRETAHGTHASAEFIVLIFDMLDDEDEVYSEYRFHAPDWVFEMRAAEYQLDSVDDALEMVLGEAAMLALPPPPDDGPRFGEVGVPIEDVRRAHQARCRAARVRHAVDVKDCREGLGNALRFNPARVARFRDELKRSPFMQAGGRG